MLPTPVLSGALSEEFYRARNHSESYSVHFESLLGPAEVEQEHDPYFEVYLFAYEVSL